MKTIYSDGLVDNLLKPALPSNTPVAPKRRWLKTIK